MFRTMDLDVSRCRSAAWRPHVQFPAKVAAAVARAPHHRHPIPFSLILSRKSFNPALPPWVCWVVLSVSMGVNVIRKAAEDRLAAMVLMSTGQVRDSRRARIPALAAVSPNLDNGA
jgi:hypothetical protein